MLINKTIKKYYHMKQLIKSVKENKCDLGLAFDGDGDRLGVVDSLGKIVWADQYMLVLCSEIAKLYDNPKVIMDVKGSKVFFDESKKAFFLKFSLT